MTECPTQIDLDRFHAGEMEDAEAGAVQAHLGDCSKCATRDASLVAAHEDLLARLRGLDMRALPPGVPQSNLTQTVPDSSEKPRQRPRVAIEGYDIIDELSHGGQGIVYRAKQQSTNREVAIKVLLDGAYASDAARKRFQREIELAAQLKHPNIITIFHSGTTEDDLQYCVMDYVEGLPLHKFTRAKELGLEDTLRLFSTVCDAIVHAHDRGVIHRDLKPSNILVNREGQPRILDFGLAKTLEGPAGFVVSFSQDVVGTLPYMSPEQAQGQRDAVDTRTDVYALGIMLYELLTGKFPYPVDGQMSDVMRHIIETPPAPPSRKWHTESGVRSKSSVGFRSGACPIDRDVQTILFKTLEKDPERRYASAAALSGDVTRYLAHEPILARPPSVVYRLKMFMRKRWLPLIAAAVILVTAGVAVSFQVRASRANEARTMESAQRLFFDAKLEAFRDPTVAIEKYEQAIAISPDFVEAMVERAFLLKRINRDEEAIEAADDIRARFSENGPVYFLLADLYVTRDPKRAEEFRKIGRRLSPNDKHYQALSLEDNRSDEAIALLTELLSEDGTHFDARWQRAWRYRHLREHEKMLEDAEVLTAMQPKLARAWNLRGLALSRLKRLDEAKEVYDRAIELSPEYAFTYLNRADLLLVMNKPQAALADCNRSLDREPDVALTHALRGRAFFIMGRLDRAEGDCRRAIALDGDTALAWRTLGNVHTRRGALQEALADLTRAIEADPSVAAIYNERGQVNHRLERYEDAISDYTTGLALDSNHRDTYNNRALAHDALGHTDKALADLTRAIEIDATFALAFHNRARLWRSQRNYALALLDHDRAISMSPSPDTYSARSLTRRFAGDIAGAIADLEQAIKQKPDRLVLYYLLVWEIQLFDPPVRDPAATSAALTAASQAALTNWDKSLVSLCMGSATESPVLALAGADEERLPEAQHYLGVLALANGQRAGAADWFRQNLQDKYRDYPEYQLARWYLETRLTP